MAANDDSASHNSIKELQKGIAQVLPATFDKELSSVQEIRPSHTIDNKQPSNTAVTLEDTEKDTIKKALERNEGKRKKTAEELQISERTLYRKIKEFGLE